MHPAAIEGTPPDGYRADHQPCGFRARVVCDGRLVAESDRAVRLDETGRAPSLYFPVDDVRIDAFVDEGRRAECPRKGTARLWSAKPATPGDPSAADVMWGFPSPDPGFAWLQGLVAFDHDHERVRVELVEGPGGDPRDVTVTAFPNWGDAAQLAAILDVRPLGGGRYAGASRADHRRSVVEGSQMLGQAVVAADRHTAGRRVVSAHMTFLRVASAAQPLEFVLSELSSGRSFTALQVEAAQDGRTCAAGTILLATVTPDVVRHAAAAPRVPGPYDCPPYDMSVTGRDVRFVDGAYDNNPGAPVGPPVIDAWVRFRNPPPDAGLHAGLLAQFTGHVSIAAALRPHAGVGQDQAHRTLSTAVNAISLSFHSEVRADEWMLYHHLSTFAGGGMTHSECRVHGASGDLVASFAVDAMVRPLERPRGASTAGVL